MQTFGDAEVSDAEFGDAEFSVAEFSVAEFSDAEFSAAEFGDALVFKDRVPEKSSVFCITIQILASGAPTAIFIVRAPWHAPSHGHESPGTPPTTKIETDAGGYRHIAGPARKSEALSKQGGLQNENRHRRVTRSILKNEINSKRTPKCNTWREARALSGSLTLSTRLALSESMFQI